MQSVVHRNTMLFMQKKSPVQAIIASCTHLLHLVHVHAGGYVHKGCSLLRMEMYVSHMLLTCQYVEIVTSL